MCPLGPPRTLSCLLSSGEFSWVLGSNIIKIKLSNTGKLMILSYIRKNSIYFLVSVQTAVSVDKFDPWPRLQTAHKPVPPPSPGRCPGAPTNGRDQLTQLSLIQNQTKQRGCQGMFFNGITFLPFSDPASSGVSMRF